MVLASVGCGEESGPTSPPEDDLRSRFDLRALGSIPYPTDNARREARIALGRLLFFDPVLGGERDVSCGTCHHPDFAFADGRQFGAGTSGAGLGPARVISHSALTGVPLQLEPRNSPTVLNTAFNADESGMPTPLGFQFWDGRVRGLEEQARKPITSRDEMRGDAYPAEVAMDSVVGRLRAIPEYVTLFGGAFPGEGASPDELVNADTYGRAIAAYERELVTRDTPYDRFVRGDDTALSESQKLGLELFFTKAKCALCHRDPMFSDFGFHVLGVPQEGVGKSVVPGDDTGRAEHTGRAEDRYAFRTPTLRNVEQTAPYMHDGVFETLEEVVRFYNDGARPRHPAVNDGMVDGRVATPLGLSEEEMVAIVDFMRSLGEPVIGLDPLLTTVPEEVPSGLVPVFGLADEP